MFSVLTQQEKIVLANREKEKGNEAFKANDYEEAVSYYSRSEESILHIDWHLIRLLSFSEVCFYFCLLGLLVFVH